jgi:predicted transcriptional regulator
MNKTVALSFRVDTDKNKRLESLAAATDRPKSWLLEQALDSYLETQAWQIEQVRQGLADIEDGRLIPDDVVWARAERRLKRRLKSIKR